MYLTYSGLGKVYASAAVSHRNGNKTSISYTYLGRVLDREKGIYENSSRGIFTFDPVTGAYGVPPESFVPCEERRTEKLQRVSVDFGDAFLLNAFLCGSGLMDVVDILGYGNPDTLHAMLLFYTLSSLANSNAIHWYEGSIVRLLYPKANMTGQRISEFLASIGTPEKNMTFQRQYIDYVLKRHGRDGNILIDSSGLPNSIHFPLTCRNVHNGKVSNEVRLVFVVQKSTGLPLFYMAVPGNVIDVATLERILLHIQALGLDIDSCIVDAGYNSAANIDLFYGDDNVCRINFITRVKASDRELKIMIGEHLQNIERKENFVRFEDRFVFIVKKAVLAGASGNRPAWLYLGLDCARVNDEQKKLMRRAVKDALSTEAVYDAMQSEGLFGLLSSYDYACEEILPAYYQRQSAEQIFDVAKNYTKLLPLRTENEETFRGHLLMSYIAACAVRMLQIELKNTDFYLGSRLEILRNQKCTIYGNQVVTDVPRRLANETYSALGISCPSKLAVIDGRLDFKQARLKLGDEKTGKDGMKAGKRNGKASNGARQEAISGNVATRGEDESDGLSSKTFPPHVTKKKGRPLGSRNKSTIEYEKAMDTESKPGKRGRPLGSGNKSTIEHEKTMETELKPRKRGRPLGSKNKGTCNCGKSMETESSQG